MVRIFANANHLNAQLPGWLLGGLVSLLAIVVWGNSFDWNFNDLSTYQVFPVLGLLAFSLMWSQYIISFAKKAWFKDLDTDIYYRVSGYIVLIAIILHPGLLVYQRARDGFGPPPGSYENYVAPGMAWITMLGSVCLLIFLAFELRRWLSTYGWWRFMSYLIDAAMVGIFYHALRLGTQTHIGWYHAVWWFYGISLFVVLLHKYLTKIASWRFG